MRHRDNIVCTDSEKAHLCRLPNFEPDEIPPRVENPSKKGLVTIPIFGSVTNSTSGTEFCGLVSALWARRSWLLNTDAMDYGVEVKLYMENHLRENEDIMSILDQNGARDEDILWFDGSSVEGAIPVSDESRLGKGGFFSFKAKKCSIYTDQQLDAYE